MYTLAISLVGSIVVYNIAQRVFGLSPDEEKILEQHCDGDEHMFI